MTPLDRDKFLKLLALIDSDQDAEALGAARKAAALIRQSGQAWDDVIVEAAPAGWRRWIDPWRRYLNEVARRVAAERSARQWHAIARLREVEITRLRDGPPAAPAAHANEADSVGHSMLDRLLASPDLDAPTRARVEAIATWFKRTRVLTAAEVADLETITKRLFSRN